MRFHFVSHNWCVFMFSNFDLIRLRFPYICFASFLLFGLLLFPRTRVRTVCTCFAFEIGTVAICRLSFYIVHIANNKVYQREGCRCRDCRIELNNARAKCCLIHHMCDKGKLIQHHTRTGERKKKQQRDM